jgi:hypothetical protein
MVVAASDDIFGKVLDSLTDCLTPEVAQRIVEIRVAPQVQARADELAVRANEGSLTAEERAQYEQFIDAMDILAIFQARARFLLSQRSRK